MSLKNQIYVRKSCRNYSDEEIDMGSIHEFMANVRPLDGDIGYHYDILKSKEMNIRTPWSAPYYLSLYSDKKGLYRENIGFIFQQLALYLQSIGIGNCWVGMASPKVKKENFVIAISFGKSDKMTRDRDSFKRRGLDEISDFEDERLIPAQLAPSAINSQPWFFRHNADGFDVYQVKQNILKRQILKNWNPIDVGIALAHLYVSNPDSFEFQRKSDFESVKGYEYTGSIKI